MKQAKVTRVEVLEDERWDYQDTSFCVTELQLDGDREVVWAKKDGIDAPKIGDSIQYEDSGKDKKGRDKIKSVKVLDAAGAVQGRGNYWNDDRKIAIDEQRLAFDIGARQLSISRAVALEKAIDYCDKIKAIPNIGGAPDIDKVLSVATIFTDFLMNGYSPVVPEVEEVKEIEEPKKKPAAKKTEKVEDDK
jgi:hypothetical protein